MKNKNKYKIGVIGMGYVGLPLSIAFSKKYSVVGYDININRINELNSGIDTTNEVKKFKKNYKNLLFSNEKSCLKDRNIFIVTVPTPVDKKNLPDLRNLSNACKLISEYLKQNSIVIFESTVYPGCTEEFCKSILEKYSNLKLNKDFYLGYSPERINPGRSKKKINDIIKITSGSNYKSAKIIDRLYKNIIPAGTIMVSSIKVAEAAKVIENTQRDLNIAFMNELSMFFDKLGLDTSEVLSAAETKWNFNKYYPGLVGGHCIGVDPYYLSFKSKLLGFKTNMILAGRKLNNRMTEYVFKKMMKTLSISKKKKINKKVLILGATFKENCPDFRNSKVFDIMRKLKQSRIFFKVYDPYFTISSKLKLDFKEKFFEFVDIKDKFDIILVAIGHDKFKRIGIKKLKKMLSANGKIFDLKSIYKKKETFFRL